MERRLHRWYRPSAKISAQASQGLMRSASSSVADVMHDRPIRIPGKRAHPNFFLTLSAHRVRVDEESSAGCVQILSSYMQMIGPQ